MNVLVMNRMSGPLRLVILSAVIRRLMDERMAASEPEKHLAIRSDLSPEERGAARPPGGAVPRTLVALDEAQNVLASERRTSAGEILTRYVREGRNYGLSFMVATEQPTALDNRILAQVDTLIAHKRPYRGTSITCEGTCGQPGSGGRSRRPHAEFDDLIRILDVGQAWVSNTEADRPAPLDTDCASACMQASSGA